MRRFGMFGLIGLAGMLGVATPRPEPESVVDRRKASPRPALPPRHGSRERERRMRQAAKRGQA